MRYLLIIITLLLVGCSGEEPEEPPSPVPARFVIETSSENLGGVWLTVFKDSHTEKVYLMVVCHTGISITEIEE